MQTAGAATIVEKWSIQHMLDSKKRRTDPQICLSSLLPSASNNDVCDWAFSRI